ncbi:unnamed protein product [Cuscuta campestris]|uniref:BED-type domain-containing protein n=1 Tax=Cuscuta campestris TaxID=132261 RepID=A0A484KRY9_9ASTE|nr:unnamed protein product [Cuscuta campestris]
MASPLTPTSPNTSGGENHELIALHNEMMGDHEILIDEMMLNNEIVPMEMENSLASEMPPKKRRKKKSMVWEFFTIESVGNGCRRACCKQCKQTFSYSRGCKVAGTSHLKRHIAKGTCAAILRNQQLLNNGDDNNNNLLCSAPAKMRGYRGGTTTNMPKRRYRTAATPAITFDVDRCRQELSRMTIMHDYPLHMVEHPGFVAFVHTLQPRFDMVSFNTVQGDCVATYLREKQSLYRLIEGMPGRICLTLDMWSSHLRVGFVFISGQFIDPEWKIHRKVLNVIREPFPESESAFSHAIAACLSDWNIDGKLLSVTVNQPMSDPNKVRALLSVQNPTILDGQLLVGNCLARTLSSIAADALTFAQDVVKKVRDSVKYVKTSESNEERFLDLKQQLQVPTTKNLSLDDRTQWNTTFEMLAAAFELKEVFLCLDKSDPDYTGSPSAEDWKLIETLQYYLKILFNTASLLAGPRIPTSNVFFHEAWKIQLELARASVSEDPFVYGLTKLMQEKFDRYWTSCYLILSIAVIVDPRFKMKLVDFSFSKIYGKDATSHASVVNKGIHELYQDYVQENDRVAKPAGGGESGRLTDFDVFVNLTSSQLAKSELDQYLDESLLPRGHGFDVVGWWKVNRTKYPTLSKMARDILTIPVSTVTGELVFGTVVPKEMDRYRCSLRPEMVEALVCAKDWQQEESARSSSSLIVSPIKLEVTI